RILGIDPRWGVVGLTASAGLAAWLEFLLLRKGMNQRIGRSEFHASYFVRLWVAAVIAAVLAWGVELLLRPQGPIVAAIAILLPYGITYLALTMLMGIDQARALFRRP